MPHATASNNQATTLHTVWKIEECASTHNSQPSPPYISMIRPQAAFQASQAESRRVQEAYPWPASSRPPAGPPEARAHARNLQPSLWPSAAAARRSSRRHFANTRRAPSATVPAVKTVSTVCFVIGVGRPRAAQTADRQRGLHWTSIPMPTSAIPAQTPKWQNPTTELCITTTEPHLIPSLIVMKAGDKAVARS